MPARQRGAGSDGSARLVTRREAACAGAGWSCRPPRAEAGLLRSQSLLATGGLLCACVGHEGSSTAWLLSLQTWGAHLLSGRSTQYLSPSGAHAQSLRRPVSAFFHPSRERQGKLAAHPSTWNHSSCSLYDKQARPVTFLVSWVCV